MRVTLIHNSKAGDDEQPGARDLQHLITAAGHDVFYQSCHDENWTAALARPADLVAVAGGDGTVGRVAKALVGRHVPFTALPLGTANNISKTLGLTDLPLEQLIAGWARGHRTAFDIGVAGGPWGLRYFIEGMGAGLFAWNMPDAHDNGTLHNLDHADAKLASALQLLRERLRCCAPCRFDAVLDGRDLSGDYLLLEVMNMQYVGPNLYLGPDCDLTDGLLDVVLVPAAQRERLQAYLSTWQDGRLRAPDLPTYRGRELQVRWTGYAVHIDDELWPPAKTMRAAPGAAIQIRMEREALEFLAPAC